MEINDKTRLNLRVQGLIFLILFLSIIGMLAWVSKHYSIESDWTANGRNTLSKASIKLTQRLKDTMTFTAFARKGNLIPARKNISDLIGRYQKYNDKIHLVFVDPETNPDKTRQMGISVEGEMVVQYQGRSEHIKNATEENITNTMQRLMRSRERKILFVSGHGERDPLGRANHDLGQFTLHLKKKGIKTGTISLTETPSIPKDTAALVIASPLVNYLDGEVKIIRDYVKQGGNLLWLHDPGSMHHLDKLASDLGIKFYPGVVVDPSTQLLGISDPTFSLIMKYPHHPITNGFNLLTLFPRAAAIDHMGVPPQWTKTALLQTVARSWSETGVLKGAIQYDKGKDIGGPLTIGLALSREIKPSNDKDKKDKKDQADKKNPQQRIVIIGDGDFLSNTFLGNQGNQDLGFAIMNWLSNDDSFIDIPAVTAPDTQINLNQAVWSVVGLIFLIVVPGGLVVAGVTVWMKRRKR